MNLVVVRFARNTAQRLCLYFLHQFCLEYVHHFQLRIEIMAHQCLGQNLQILDQLQDLILNDAYNFSLPVQLVASDTDLSDLAQNEADQELVLLHIDSFGLEIV